AAAIAVTRQNLIEPAQRHFGHFARLSSEAQRLNQLCCLPPPPRPLSFCSPRTKTNGGNMQPLHTYNVIPKLPQQLEPLRDIVSNLWWTWEPSARSLFRHLDPVLWDRTNHNPVRMLQMSRQARLIDVSEDDDFHRKLHAVHRKFKSYLADGNAFGKGKKGTFKNPIAYFTAEVGFHESVPNYSGGLGILS